MEVTIKLGTKAAQASAEASIEAYGAVEQARAEQRLTDAYVATVTARAAEKLAVRAAAGTDPDMLEIAALVDPTGIVNVVDEFAKPICEETPLP